MGYLRYSVNETYFKKIDTGEKAYWLGFILTDGCVMERTKNQKEFSINLQQNDFEHLVKFKNSIESNNKIDFRTDKRGSKSTRIRIFNKNFVDSLIEKGIEPRKTGKTKPLSCIPKKYNTDFWRGCVDGDGMLRVRKDGCYVCNLVGDYELVNGFKTYCGTIVNTNKNNIRPQENIYTFTVTGKKAEKIIKKLYGNCTVSLNRKQEIAKTILNV